MKRIPALVLAAKSPPKIDLVEHCRTLAAMYTKAAEEADALAKAHRDMAK